MSVLSFIFTLNSQAAAVTEPPTGDFVFYDDGTNVFYDDGTNLEYNE